MWAIFGGSMEARDRNFAACAAREATVETGATQKLLGLAEPLADVCQQCTSHGLWVPGMYRWRTYLVRLSAIPPVGKWPVEHSWSDEFIEVGWFGINNLPTPLSCLTKVDIWRAGRELRTTLLNFP
jgi:8-oxo-dGTP pyrophosphatase MutT (NUDIX family)